MASNHEDLNDRLLLGASDLGHRLWRNARGIAYNRDGSTVKFGVGPNGAGDLLGGTRVVVTPEMVGQTLLVFTSVEAKTGNQRPREDQRAWLDTIKRLGGIALWGRQADPLLAQLAEPERLVLDKD